MLLLAIAGIGSGDGNSGGGVGSSSGDSVGSLMSRLEMKGAGLTKTGTTIVGVCCRDGVVLGADTRSTGGPLVIDKNKLKIHTVAPRIFCCAAGVSADCDQVTRSCSHLLSLQRIEHELAGETQQLDSIFFAVSCIQDLLQTPVGNRLPESALILGGLDQQGPALYHITEKGAQRTTFCALGSGSVDAIAVLESARRKWGPPKTISFQDGESCLEQQVENVDAEDAVSAVRNAVQAGILNDLGSGSHVDICVIKRDEVRRWREELKTSPIGGGMRLQHPVPVPVDPGEHKAQGKEGREKALCEGMSTRMVD